MRTVKKLSEKEKTIIINGKELTGKQFVSLVEEDNREYIGYGMYKVVHPYSKKEYFTKTFITNNNQVWFKELNGQWELLLG